MKDKVIYECELKDFEMCKYFGGCRFIDFLDYCEGPSGIYNSETIFEHPEDPDNQIFICERCKDCPFNFLKFNTKVKIVIER